MSSKPKCLTEKQRLMVRQKITDLLDAGQLSMAKIAKQVGCSLSLVVIVKRELKAKPRPMTRDRLPPDSVIAGENFLAKNLGNELSLNSDPGCLGCLRPMWTRDITMENLCEVCMYQQMRDAADAQTQRDVPKASHAFDEANDIGGGGFDFQGDIFKLF